MTLPPSAKMAVIILFTPLFLIDLADWLFKVIYNRELGSCFLVSQYTDTDLLLYPHFVYFSNWATWLTMVVFVAWAIPGGPILKALGRKVFWVALPCICAVTTAYIYYAATNPQESYLNLEDCHVFKTIGRAGLSKDFAPDRTAGVDAYLVFQIIKDFTKHYLCTPLLLLLLFSGEFTYEPLVPYCCLFQIVVGGAILIATSYGVPVYAEDAWFAVYTTVLITLLYHILFAMWHRRVPSCLCHCCSKSKGTEEEDEKEEDEENDEEKGADVPPTEKEGESEQ